MKCLAISHDMMCKSKSESSIHNCHTEVQALYLRPFLQCPAIYELIYVSILWVTGVSELKILLIIVKFIAPAMNSIQSNIHRILFILNYNISYYDDIIHIIQLSHMALTCSISIELDAINLSIVTDHFWAFIQGLPYRRPASTKKACSICLTNSLKNILANAEYCRQNGLKTSINVRICMEYKHLGVITIFVKQLVEVILNKYSNNCEI
ncbi:hypothetical protein AGLY_008857 [Aphis glycines]|uniref:Uncharacterized protein n=1 Tax=Aphis glycines TaxID=307491 RepID=A0A6G0TL49_APHGL|nr:hypothetical protein AGLY_008857 [Aphis glycines]